MCSTPSMPKVDTDPKPVATPTIADASVTKAATNIRNKVASLANRNINTTPRGLLEDVPTEKKGLLGE